MGFCISVVLLYDVSKSNNFMINDLFVFLDLVLFIVWANNWEPTKQLPFP